MSAGARVGRGRRGEGGPKRELRYAGATGGGEGRRRRQRERRGRGPHRRSWGLGSGLGEESGKRDPATAR